MSKWLRDPLAAFLGLGVLVFTVAALLGNDGTQQVVEVTPAEINRIKQQWSAQMGRPPTAAELDGLLEQFVQEEIYYREAQRLSLDRSDTIVRRRLVQKLRFLTEDLATGQAPGDAELLAFYEDNAALYRLPERYSFHHRYFSTDRREDAEADALAALAEPTTKGDPFMLQRTYAERSAREIGDLFGRPFVAALQGLSPSPDWQGPIRSAYGWHLVRLEQKLPPALRPFQDVAARVAADLNAERRQAANAAYYEELRSRYQVRRPAEQRP